ncbi:hypothetical protein BDV3_000710 [Batrachochytrium dendrobatidis]|uniref:Peptidase M16 N-terminal domain-containing protein n=3 Tax=Batrachochytrium dendrobatidis (strain JEL423) TaxID=403673 RepID=A0A177W8I9_BATDL|nr:hypothetical protein BDEG_20270 [Batrachochytrium dendrobatidis JEL423]
MRSESTIATDRVFSLESTERFKIPSGTSRIRVYKLSHSEFRIIFVEVPGPLCSASIVFPTISVDNKGLPHTLEHLVFCGSQTIPNRGYLDFLATRCLSTGTNAYTSEDHTSYEITTAGSEGMIEILPVFLDHILNPTLRKCQFTTEVYHLNHEAKHQGVVYCEMASRENGEQDLLDRNIRQLLYQGETTYSFECGGLTKDIIKLNNQEIIDYHSKFYRIENATMVITGTISQSGLFAKLLEHEEIFADKPPLEDSFVTPVIKSPALLNGTDFAISRKVPFASADMDVGSIGYGWRGPPSEDVFTIIALDLLYTYLHSNAASILSQAFVERADPLASSVDFDIKGYVDTSFIIYFSGVPYFDEADVGSDVEMDIEKNSDSNDEDTDSEDESDDDEDTDSENDSDDDEDSDSAHRNLFQPNVFYGLLRNALRSFATNGFTVPGGMLATIKRHRCKIMKALEEEPHDTITNLLLPDIIRHHLAASSALGDTRAEHGTPKIATRSKLFDILDILEKKDDEYWKKLTCQWLLEKPICEVLMIPSSKLALEQQKIEQCGIQDRVKVLGKEGLGKLKAEADRALAENKINITDDLMAKFPAIPDASKAPSLVSNMTNINLDEYSNTRGPFSACQVVRTETAFVSVRFGLNTSHILEELRPYLVLFQELLFETDLVLPATLGSKTITMEYQEVVRYASQVFVSHEAAIGFGNEVWSASWLSQVLMVSAVSECADWECMIRFLAQVLFFSEFTESRILTVAKNLLSNITEIKRDGACMLSAVTTRLYSAKSLSSKNTSDKASDAKCGLPEQSDTLIDQPTLNDAAISIFTQEKFLRGIVKLLKDGEGSKVKDHLNQLKLAILSGNQKSTPAFIQIGVPKNFSLSGGASLGQNSECVDDILCIWSTEFTKYKSRQTPKGTKRRLSVNDTADQPASLISPFPFPRNPFQYSHLDLKLGRGLLVPIPGLTTSYVSQFVACDVFASHPHPDYFATVLLAEILSRSEGPLYDAVRGPGYAYGVSLSVCLWIGQLSLDLYDASEPHKSVMAFYRILNTLATKSGMEEICSEFNIETARAAVAYRWVADCATADGVVQTALRSSLQGFESLEQHQKYIEHLYTVKLPDLERVFRRYYVNFLKVSKRVTVVVTVPGASAEKLINEFKQGMCEMNQYNQGDDAMTDKIALKQIQLSDLQYGNK